MLSVRRKEEAGEEKEETCERTEGETSGRPVREEEERTSSQGEEERKSKQEQVYVRHSAMSALPFTQTHGYEGLETDVSCQPDC